MAVNRQQKQRGRGPGRPFTRGYSGNPAGRPVGSRNAATEVAQALLDGEADALMRKCVEMALEGDRGPVPGAGAARGWGYRAGRRLSVGETVFPLAAPFSAVAVAELLP